MDKALETIADALALLSERQPAAPAIHVPGRAPLTYGDLGTQIRYVRDRLGNWKYLTYDSLQQLTSETNELGRATTYSYCDCGALESITDALGNVTT